VGDRVGGWRESSGISVAYRQAGSVLTEAALGCWVRTSKVINWSVSGGKSGSTSTFAESSRIYSRPLWAGRRVGQKI